MGQQFGNPFNPGAISMWHPGDDNTAVVYGKKQCDDPTKDTETQEEFGIDNSLNDWSDLVSTACQSKGGPMANLAYVNCTPGKFMNGVAFATNRTMGKKYNSLEFQGRCDVVDATLTQPVTDTGAGCSYIPIPGKQSGSRAQYYQEDGKNGISCPEGSVATGIKIGRPTDDGNDGGYFLATNWFFGTNRLPYGTNSRATAMQTYLKCCNVMYPYKTTSKKILSQGDGLYLQAPEMTSMNDISKGRLKCPQGYAMSGMRFYKPDARDVNDITGLRTNLECTEIIRDSSADLCLQYGLNPADKNSCNTDNINTFGICKDLKISNDRCLDLTAKCRQAGIIDRMGTVIQGTCSDDYINNMKVQCQKYGIPDVSCTIGTLADKQTLVDAQAANQKLIDSANQQAQQNFNSAKTALNQPIAVNLTISKNLKIALAIGAMILLIIILMMA